MMPINSVIIGADLSSRTLHYKCELFLNDYPDTGNILKYILSTKRNAMFLFAIFGLKNIDF